MTDTTQQGARPIYVLIPEVMDAVGAVRKSNRNTEQNYNFRGVDDVVNAAGPELRKRGIYPVPKVLKTSCRDVQTSRGKPAREVTVTVRYRFRGPAGDYEDVVVPGEAMDFSDKGTAKAMSVAYRIAILQLLCIPTDDVTTDEQNISRGAGRSAGKSKGGPDPAALDDLFEKVRDAGTKTQLQNLWRKAAQGVKDGSWTEADAIRVQQAITKRTGELTAAEAQPDAEVPATAQRASARQAVVSAPLLDGDWPTTAPIPNGAGR